VTRNRAALAMLFAVAACGRSQAIDPMQQVGPNPILPEPSEDLVPRAHFPKVVGWTSGEAPAVPPGFRVQAMARGLTSVRTAYPLANGDILAVQSARETVEPIERPKNGFFNYFFLAVHGSAERHVNRIVLLRDANGDGEPELQSVLLDHLNIPFGVAQVGGDLYVADTDAILRYPFTPGQTRITTAPQTIVALPAGRINHHFTKSLTASPDGSKLYVGVGSNSNVGERGPEAEAERATIWEVDPKTGAHRIFADGTRNPTGLAFYPGSERLWTVVNERDELGPNLVPDYLTSVRSGGFYGWPYSYYGHHLDPRVRPQRPDLVARAIPPDYALSSHVAPLGLAFYTGASFPPIFHGGAFVGEHGSWNRYEPAGYRVVFIRFVGGRPVGKPVPFATGFLNRDGNARGRPVSVAMDRTGALIVADDAGNVVWRISYAAAASGNSTHAAAAATQK
jgi:glucose/arabinose dehydrogenase